MKKIELIWRELLYQALEKGENHFVQKDLAWQFNCSTSTIFQALKAPRKMGAVKVGGRKFILEDPEKLLYHWASVRSLKKEILYQTRVDLPVLEIESSLIPEVIFGGFSAFRLRFKDFPADYDQVWVYLKEKDQPLIKQRFPQKKGTPNLWILKADPYLKKYGETTTLGQTFVDLWNLDVWYAKEFTQALKEKIDEILS